LPLFVVVVAVDPRWLLGALHHHYRELFDGNANPSGYEPPDDLVSPLDYLDKIFQIPFALRPMEPAATGTYLATLPGQRHGLCLAGDPLPRTAEASTQPQPRRAYCQQR
jgi:hypothetical protein